MKKVKIVCILLLCTLAFGIVGDCTSDSMAVFYNKSLSKQESAVPQAVPEVISPLTQKTSFGPAEPEMPVCNGARRNVAELGAKGDGVSDDTGAFLRGLYQLNDGILFIPAGTYRIKTSFTIGSNVMVVFAHGASLSLDKGVTVTINGYVDAPSEYIFKGEGVVTGNIQGIGYPQWFGNVPCGIDDSAVIQKAVNALSYMRMEQGIYVFGDISINKPITIEGIGGTQVTCYLPSYASRMFTIRTNNFEMRNFYLTGASNSSCVAFYFDTSAQNIYGISLDNFTIARFGNFIKDAQSSVYTINNVSLTGCSSFGNYSNGIYMTDFIAGIYMQEVHVDNLGGQNDGYCWNSPMFYIANCQDMTLWNVDAAGGALFGADGDGFYFENCSGIKGERIMCDYVNGYSLVMVNCTDCDIKNFVGSLNQEGCGYFQNVTNSRFDIFKANGFKEDTTFQNPQASMVLNGCQGLIFNNIIVQDHRGAGLLINDSQNNTFNSLVCIDNFGYGLNETGTSNGNTFNGAVLRNNYSGATLCGSTSVIYALTVNSTYYSQMTA